MFCGINATASTLLACIDLCCHTWSSHRITLCSARDVRNRDNPVHCAVTGSQAHSAAAAACTKLEKCDWHIFLKSTIGSKPGSIQAWWATYYYCLCHIRGQKRVNWYELMQFYILKGDGCLFDRRRLLTQNLNTLKCTIKHFINPGDTAQAAGLYYD